MGAVCRNRFRLERSSSQLSILSVGSSLAGENVNDFGGSSGCPGIWALIGFSDEHLSKLNGWLDSGRGFLKDEVQMQLGKLVIFEMSANAPLLGGKVQNPGDCQGRMIQRLSQKGIGNLPGLIHATAGENQNSAWAQALAQLSEDCFLIGKRHMPDAVPC